MVSLSQKYQPYPAYKPSGVEWLGEIPAHWEVRRLKYLSSSSGLYGANVPATLYSDEGVRFIRTTDISSDGVLAVEGVFVPEESVQGYILNDGDILLSRSGTIGRSFLYDQQIHGPCAYAGYLVRFVLNESVNPYYIALYLRSAAFEGFVRSIAISSTIDNVNADKYSNLPVPFPPLPEQQTIAAFLDRETARIDALVIKKERLIELLQEKRAALITHAVTRGLDPDAPMQDSGVEWLGEIPAHWEVKRLKHIGNLQGGAGFPHQEQWDTTQEYPFFKVGDMAVDTNQREMFEYQHTVSGDTANRLGAYVFPPMTIVFAKVGAALLLNRRRMIVRPSCIDNNMMGFIPRGPDPDWMMYWLSGLDFGKLANPGAVPSVNEGQMREQEAVLPPIREQQAIAAFLVQETEKLDNLIAKIREAIARLRELRTALISAAVTGRIDVREEAGCR